MNKLEKFSEDRLRPLGMWPLYQPIAIAKHSWADTETMCCDRSSPNYTVDLLNAIRESEDRTESFLLGAAVLAKTADRPGALAYLEEICTEYKNLLKAERGKIGLEAA